MATPASPAISSAAIAAQALQRLHDIAEPAAPPMWPPAPGWYVLATAISLLLLCALLAIHSRRRQHAYRRAAQHELAALRQRFASGHASDHSTAKIVDELATLLRRVALHGMPRHQVAALSGQAWVEHLAARAPMVLAPNVASLLCNGPYARPNGNSAANDADLAAAFDYARAWIRTHRLAKRETP